MFSKKQVTNLNLFEEWFQIKIIKLNKKIDFPQFFCSGVATIKVRVPDKTTGGRLITLHMKLDVLVEDLYMEISGKLDVTPNL